MRYNINARFIYDATDGTFTLPQSNEPDSQLSITASALLNYFLHNTGIISRDEVLKKVWDDNGLTSSNSNLNQYLSMLRKTCRHYGIDNIIVTVSRGYLQLNPDVVIEAMDASPVAQPELLVQETERIATESPAVEEPTPPSKRCTRAACAGISPGLVCSLLRYCWWHLAWSEPANRGPSH